MTKRDGAAAAIDLVERQVELVAEPKHHGRKSFVDLPDVDIRGGEPCAPKRLTSSLAWCREHDAWLRANAGAANDAPAHCQVVLLGSLDRGEQDGSRAVDDPG